MPVSVDKNPTWPDRSTNRRLAFAVLAPPAAWFTLEVVGLVVVGRHCAAGQSLAAWQWAVIVSVTLAAAAVAIAAGFTAWRVFRTWSGDTPVTEAEGWSRVEFVALLGLFLSALLLLNIVYFGIMPFLVHPCTRVI